MMSVLLFPIVPFIMQVGIFIFAVWVGGYLYTWGRPICHIIPDVTSTIAINGTQECLCPYVAELEGKIAEENCVFSKYSEDDKLVFYLKVCYFNWLINWLIKLQLFNLFGMFWALFFIQGLAELTLAGAFASYYWAFNKPKDVPAMPLTQGFYRAIRFVFD